MQEVVGRIHEIHEHTFTNIHSWTYIHEHTFMPDVAKEKDSGGSLPKYGAKFKETQVHILIIVLLNQTKSWLPG